MGNFAENLGNPVRPPCVSHYLWLFDIKLPSLVAIEILAIALDNDDVACKTIGPILCKTMFCILNLPYRLC